MLRRIEGRAAMLRYWADAGARHETPPRADALSGLSDALGDIGALAAAMRAALPERVLAKGVPRPDVRPR